ncbi:MAG: hypothetical protein NT070_10195 [Cyanobacteria bacterium]|nr:hypothetical protein [Cyanobacteriota bacterium]
MSQEEHPDLRSPPSIASLQHVERVGKIGGRSSWRVRRSTFKLILDKNSL